jgi:TetR/AcrR family transcriptional repressor of nem operon
MHLLSAPIGLDLRYALSVARSKEFDPETALDRAMGRFWAAGYEGTSTQELMAVMRVGKRSMYDTFGNKRALYLSALDEYVRRAELVHQTVLDADGPVVDRIEALLCSGLRLPDATPPGCFAVNAGTDRGGDPDVRAIVDGHFERSTDRIAAVLRQAGGARAAALAPLVHTAWIGLRARSAAGLSEDGQQAVIRQIAALVS